MRGFVGFLITGGLLLLPALAQRLSDGHDARVFVAPGYREGFAHDRFGVYRGDYLAGHRYVGLGGVGLPAGWPVNSESWDDAVSVPDNSYSDNGSGLCQGCTYGDLSASSVEQQSSPKITDYSGHDQICPQANGKSLYRIAIPPNRPDRRGKVQLTYQNNLSVAHDYWYTEGKLNFVTMQDEEISTSISSVDRGLTVQLNRECGVNFQFPKREDGIH
jgi:hypothetical protein